MSRKLFLLLLICLAFNLIVTSNIFACVGARPLAMGGAFVGVADDANAVYWNPAGLTQLEDVQFTYTPTLYDRDEVNYDDFVSLVFPLELEGDKVSLGISFVNSGHNLVSDEVIDRWVWLSYAVQLPGNLSLGTNLRYRDYEWKINEGYMLSGTSVTGPIKDSDNSVGIDLSLFWKWDKLSAGLLWQDINEPEFNFFDDRFTLKYARNLRPGLAFRPDEKTILSVELYDIASRTSDSNNNLRLGAERWFDLPAEGAKIALRAGGYDINDDLNRAITGGIGCEFGQNDKWPMTFSIDYAAMYWTDAPSSTEDWTHMLGFKVSFPWDFSAKAKVGKEITGTVMEIKVIEETEVDELK
ncbi:MAG: type IX secretion system membrane protein PorP/SprF [Candidatus Omnitrophota bacterium]